MFHRLLKLTNSRSFFLFGPRGTGKSTLLKTQWKPGTTLYIDFLDPQEEDLFRRDPRELERRVEALSKKQTHVILDEIQKAPRLLDLIHRLIESTHRTFVMTGSSARKLKRGVSNLLAGRAFVYHLHPLTASEIGSSFQLIEALKWGTLPRIFQLTSSKEKAAYLRAYALTYLKEEIISEQLIRRIDPFRNFLEVAAQCNGQILNFSKIARDVGVDTKTTQTFFEILEDTLIGFLLPAYHRSIRKRQNTQPKFFFFDLGVKRALERSVEQGLYPKTYAFGQAFEHFVVLEVFRLGSYTKPDWRFSYIRTKDGAEIDLVIDRPGKPLVLLEIKSTDHVTDQDISTLARFKKDIPHCEAYCLSLDPHSKKIGTVHCFLWNVGLAAIGLS